MSLETKREKIDTIDAQLIELMVARLSVAKEIVQEKARTHQPLTNKPREQEIFDKLDQQVASEVRPYVHTLFEDLILVSKQYQAHLIKEIQDQAEQN